MPATKRASTRRKHRSHAKDLRGQNPLSSRPTDNYDCPISKALAAVAVNLEASRESAAQGGPAAVEHQELPARDYVQVKRTDAVWPGDSTTLCVVALLGMQPLGGV